MTIDELLELDKHDPLANKRAEFDLPQNTIYLDGNSLGALPKTVSASMTEAVNKQWGQDLIKSWNTHAWIDLPVNVGEKIARIIGAGPGQVICCDSISINLFKVISAGLSLNKNKNIILSTKDNFPTDLYMAQGMSELLGASKCQLHLIDEDEIEGTLAKNKNDAIAILLLTHVNFRSGKKLDMAKLTNLAHDQGIIVIWDLAHSAGALELHLDVCQVDFAVGCGYKYLNGGPGAPAFLYVATRHQAKAKQALTGWMGHAKPFAFNSKYQAAYSINHYLTGTPNIMSMKALEAAMDIWNDVSMFELREKSKHLQKVFLEIFNKNKTLVDFSLVSPVDIEQRGSQLAFSHRDAFSICQALIEQGVIADFRAPNILRFGFTPLYTSYEDIWRAVNILINVVKSGIYQQERFNVRAKVT